MNKINTNFLFFILIFPILGTATDDLVYNSSQQDGGYYNLKSKKKSLENTVSKKPFKPIVTYLLVMVNTITFTISIFSTYLIKKGAYYTKAVRYSPKQWYRLLTAGFLHTGFIHFFSNMVTLYVYGKYLERAYFKKYKYYKGSLLYTFLYFGSIISGSVWRVLFDEKKTAIGWGASGGIYGLITASISINPNKKDMLGIPRWLFYSIIILSNEFFTAYMTKVNVGHIVHLGGALFGVVYPIIFTPGLLKSKSPLIHCY